MEIRTVLIVDDEHDIRVCLRQVLEAEGYFVVSAADGRSAIQLLEHISPPDVVLFDINMPLMNGDQFLQAVRSNPKTQSIPMLQMSAAGAARREGVLGVLSKPFGLEQILKAIETCLERNLEQSKT